MSNEFFLKTVAKDSSFTQRLNEGDYNFFHARPERIVKMTKLLNRLIAGGKLAKVEAYDASKEDCEHILNKYYLDQNGNCTAPANWKAAFLEHGLIKGKETVLELPVEDNAVDSFEEEEEVERVVVQTVPIRTGRSKK